MQEIIKVDSQFNGLTSDEFYNSPNDDCRVVCLSSRQVTLIRKALVPLYWSTRFGEYINPTLWRVLDNSEVRELLEETEVNLMANCFDEFAEILGSAIIEASDKLAFAIISANGGNSINVNCGNGTCGNGSGGAGSSSSGYSQTQIPTPGIGTPPEGFSDWSEYNAYSCSVANHIVKVIRDDLERAATVNWNLQTFTVIAGILIPLLLDPIPGDEVLVLVGILIAVHEQAETLLNNMAQVMDDNHDDLVCSLLNQTSVENAELSIEGKWAEVWYASEFASIVWDWAAIQSFNVMVNPDALNKLVDKDTSRTYNEGECDCDDCHLYVEQGTIVSEDGYTYTVESVLSEGSIDYQIVNAWYYDDNDTTCDVPRAFQIISIDGRQPSENTHDDDFYLADNVGVVYQSDVQPTDEYNIVRAVIAGHYQYPFTVTFTWH